MNSALWLCLLLPLAVALLGGARMAAAAEAPRPDDTASTPRAHVFLSEADLARVRAKVARQPWAQAIAGRVVDRAEAWLRRPQPIPEGETGWFHNYFDPRYGVQLRYDPDQPHQHRSPVDGRVFSGEPYDGAWRYLTHTRIAGAAVDLALAYALTGEARYARGAAAILLEYARRYPSAPVHGQWAGKGKMMGQSLDEAVWAIQLLRAYDLVADAGVLQPGERRLVEEDLFGGVARLLRPQTNRVHNIHAWHDAALAMIGLVTGDEELVRFALADPRSGFVVQLSQGVLDDGFWWEGSIGYHFYTLSAFQHLAGALRAAGRPIPSAQHLLGMYEAPVRYADPDLVFPALNDGWPGSTLRQQAAFYEIAAGWFDPERFVPVLRRLYAGGQAARESLEALLWGPEELPGVEAAAAAGAEGAGGGTEGSADTLAGSHNFLQSGIGILRRSGHYALVKYGPHGGGHGHPDKLGLVLYGLGEMLSPDLGTPGYGVPLTGSWYRQTVSHNTLVVDERSQQPATGRLLAWVPGEGFDAVSVAVDGAYPGVTLQRTLILTDTFLAFVDTARSQQAHVYDWVYHQRGRWAPAGTASGLTAGGGAGEGDPRASEAAGAGTGAITGAATGGGLAAVTVLHPESRLPLGRPLAASAGYQHLAEVRQVRLDGTWRVDWLTPRGQRVSLWMAGAPGTEVFLAQGPGNPATEQLPAVLVRRRGQEAVWAGAFDLSGRGAVAGVAVGESGGGWLLQVETPAGPWAWRISEDGRVERVP